jgi:hypothetical protein
MDGAVNEIAGAFYPFWPNPLQIRAMTAMQT